MKKILLITITALALTQTASAETYLECIKRADTEYPNTPYPNEGIYEYYYKECDNGSFNDPAATKCAAQSKDPKECTKDNFTEREKDDIKGCARMRGNDTTKCENLYLIACRRNIYTAVHRCYTDVYMQPLCAGNGNSCPCDTGYTCYDPEIGPLPTSPPSSGTQARCIDSALIGICPIKAGINNGASGLPGGGTQGTATAEAQPNREPDCGRCCSPNAATAQPTMPAYRMPVVQQQATPPPWMMDPARYMTAPMRRPAPQNISPGLRANALGSVWDWLFGR